MLPPDLSPPDPVPGQPAEASPDPTDGAAVIGTAHPELWRGEVLAAFRELHQALNLPRSSGPPTFRRLVLDAWDLAEVLYSRCPGGVNYGSLAERRRKLAASVLAWVEAVLVADTALQLAERLPILRGRPGEMG